MTGRGTRFRSFENARYVNYMLFYLVSWYGYACICCIGEKTVSGRRNLPEVNVGNEVSFLAHTRLSCSEGVAVPAVKSHAHYLLFSFAESCAEDRQVFLFENCRGLWSNCRGQVLMRNQGRNLGLRDVSALAHIA